MARNRKRRGDRRPSDATSSRPGVATARPQRDASFTSRADDTSDPIGHAAPDAELAEAQLAAAQAESSALSPVGESDPVDETRYEEAELGADDELADSDGELDDGSTGARGPGGPASRRRGGGGGGDSGGELTPHPAAGSAAAPRRRNRLVAFAQGSWRELQRVQWPDRRQVVQATGVVIGFVIVAGAYLGLADWVAGKIVHFILS